jgi:hypothetical protein
MAAHIETPRLVKKPGGLTKRVENQQELEAAQADGWLVSLQVAAAEPLVEAPETPEPAPEPEPGPDSVVFDGVPDESNSGESTEVDEPETAKRKSGRSKKSHA